MITLRNPIHMFLSVFILSVLSSVSAGECVFSRNTATGPKDLL